jgi:heat shock protein HslJ
MKKNLIITAIFALLLSSCAVKKTNQPVFNFEGQSLHLVELNGVAYTTNMTDEPVVLNFSTAENKVNGHSGCNQLFGQYKAENGSIKFLNMAMTRRMCDEATNKIEMQLAQVLETANAYKAEKGKVTLYNGKTPLAVFEVK